MGEFYYRSLGPQWGERKAYEVGAMLEARDKAWRDMILSLDSELDNSMWGNALFRSRILLLTLIPDETKGGIMKLLPSKEEFTKKASQEYLKEERERKYLYINRPIEDLGAMYAEAFLKAMNNLYDWLETREE